tara:strand:- start:442 stop:726 length:285 start_codon:yes stop_codon:yes gene_type:complete
MRLKDEMIEYLARTIVDNLAKKGGYIEFKEKKDKVENEIKMVIREDLLVEDRLNEEVKDILQTHSREIDRGNVDYAKMFNLIKSKLVRERGLIL